MGLIIYSLKKVYDLVSDTAQEIVTLNNNAQGMAMTANGLKAWELGFQGIGLSAQSADQAIASMRNRVAGMVYNPNPMTMGMFARFGIDVMNPSGQTKNPEQITKDVLAKITKMPNYYSRIATAQQFGIDATTIEAVRNNPKLLNDIASNKAKDIVTNPEVDRAKAMVKSQTDLQASVDSLRYKAFDPLSNIITQGIIPPLKQLSDLLNSITGFFGAGNSASQSTPVGQTSTFDYVSRFLGKAIPSGIVTNKMNDLGIANKMSQEDIKTMLYIANKESGVKNILGSVISKTTGKPVANGVLQYQDSTIKGLLGNNANAMNLEDSVKAFAIETTKFKALAKQLGISPTQELAYEYHHLGEPAFKKILQLQKQGKISTYGQAYGLLDKSRLMAQQNQGMINQALPSAYNSVINNAGNSVSNNHKTTHINSVNITTNNPKTMLDALNNHYDIDRINSMGSVLA